MRCTYQPPGRQYCPVINMTDCKYMGCDFKLHPSHIIIPFPLSDCIDKEGDHIYIYSGNTSSYMYL